MLIPVAVMGSGEPPILLSQAFSMSAQQIKDSTLTPHEIIPAPGAGKMNVPTMYVWRFVAGITPFTAPDVELVIGDFNANTVISAILDGPDLAGWSVGPYVAGTYVGFVEGGDPADYINQPIRLRANLRGAIETIGPNGFGFGGGYAVGDTGTVDDGSPDATYIVDSVNGSVPDAVTITDPGDGYILGVGGSASYWTTTPGGAQPGVGTGMQFFVTEVDASASAGDGTLSGIIYYLVADMA